MAWTQVFEPQFPNSKGKRSRRKKGLPRETTYVKAQNTEDQTQSQKACVINICWLTRYKTTEVD